ncbi:hypothetical protein Hanom_Chr09g00802871 [Helianthus anomalus]
MSTIKRKAGTTPRTLRVAGIDMIPAPIMLVETLNTAPETDGCLSVADVAGESCSGNSGTMLSELTGDIVCDKY